jgi:hypothetical protein
MSGPRPAAGKAPVVSPRRYLLHGAFEGMLGQWGSALPHFGASSASLSGALTGAAATYGGVDTALAAGTGANP